MASISSLIVNTVNHLFAKTGTKPKVITTDYFMPKWGVKEEEITNKQSVEQQKAALQGIASRSYTPKKKKLNDSVPPTKKTKK